MAVAKLVCGDCGNALSPSDAFCPKCGAKIERTAQVQQQPGRRTCQACGYLNSGERPYCESCGALLDETSGVRSSGGERRTEKIRKQGKPKEKGERGKKFEPWQAVSLVAVVVLAGYLIYTEATRDQPRAGIAPPPGSSAQPTVAPPPLEPLQQAVDANPQDPAALIRLANGLHDNGMYLRAISVYKKYLDLRPNDPNARVDMGICYYQLGLADSLHAEQNFSTAVKEMETAFKANPTHQPAAFNLGIVYLHMGNLDESNSWFKRAYELNKSSDLGARAQKILQEHTVPQ